jgi:hypothetical protein
MANFLDDYNQLVSMYKGSSELVKLLDSFYTFVDKLTDPSEIVPDYQGPANKLEYRDCYGVRKAVYKHTVKYLEDYFSDVAIQDKYTSAWGTLKDIQTLFLPFQGLKKVDYFVANKTSLLVQVQLFSAELAANLRDPLMKAIRGGAESATSEKTTGSSTFKGAIETTNTQAYSLYNNIAKAQMSNPTVLSVTSSTRASDIHSITESKIQAKKQENVVQNEILNKLADGRYLSDLLSKAENIDWLKTGFNATTGAPSSFAQWLNTKTKDYALNNLIHSWIISKSDPNPQEDRVKKEFRDRARKKYGDVRFCDEEEQKDVNGNWVLKKDSEAKRLLEKSRKELRNKLLKLK